MSLSIISAARYSAISIVAFASAVMTHDRHQLVAQSVNDRTPVPAPVDAVRFRWFVDFDSTSVAVGELRSFHTLNIVSPLGATSVSRVMVAVGDHVSQGTVVAVLDSLPYRKVVQETRGRLSGAQESLRRLRLRYNDVAETVFKENCLHARMIRGAGGTRKAPGKGILESVDPPARRALIRGLAEGFGLRSCSSDGVAMVRGAALNRRHWDEYVDLESQVQQLEASVNSFEASLRSNLRNLSATVIRAPTTGYVTDLRVSMNHPVYPGMHIATVENPDSLEAVVLMDEAAVSRIRNGDRFVLRLTAFPSMQFNARVLYTRIVNFQTELRLRPIDGLDLPARALPGMSVIALSLVQPRRNLGVPRDALAFREDSPGVFVVRDDDAATAQVVATYRPVKLNDAVIETWSTRPRSRDIPGQYWVDLDLMYVEVESGLVDGDRVVRGGAVQAWDGSSEVLVVPPSFSAALDGRRVFSECAACPTMVVVPPGSFVMGSLDSEQDRGSWEGPPHRVSIGYSFAVGVHEVTFHEWDACVAGDGCRGYLPDDLEWGRGQRPVIHVSWEDAIAYVRWLSQETGQDYRLLSEAEWEYMARAGTQTAQHWEGEGDRCLFANADDYRSGGGCNDGYDATSPVGVFLPNTFGVHDVLGNVSEWTEDCWHRGYAGAPTDGSAWTAGGDCDVRVLRGGDWQSYSGYLRFAHRESNSASFRSWLTGFRVARTMN